jgi:hypothetical protein
MCLSGTIDALYKKNDGTKYILRGRHYYPLDNPSQVVEALEIAKSLGISPTKAIMTPALQTVKD